MNKLFFPRLAIVLLISMFSVYGHASLQDEYFFTSSVHQEHFEKLTHTLRCLVCQNQSLADSHAPLAQDLRNKIYTQIREGKTEKEIREYMVARYGKFVLYDPPFSKTTLFLWVFPWVFFVMGFFFLARRFFLKNQGKKNFLEGSYD